MSLFIVLCRVASHNNDDLLELTMLAYHLNHFPSR